LLFTGNDKDIGIGVAQWAR